MLLSKTGAQVAIGVNRLVVGGRGSYYEFEREHLNWDAIFIPEEQKYRLTEKYADVVYYVEYRTKPDNIKIYHQRKYVGYADYVPDKFYISKEDLVLKEECDIQESVHKSVQKKKKEAKAKQLRLTDFTEF